MMIQIVGSSYKFRNNFNCFLQEIFHAFLVVAKDPLTAEL